MFSKQGFITVCLVILAALLITGCVPTTPAITPEPTRTPTPIPEGDETYPDLQEWLFGDAQNVTLTAKWGERDCKTWGPEKKPLLWNCQHTGIDYAALAGTLVYSATKGKVIRVEHGKDCNGLKCLSTVAIYDETTDVTFIYLHTKDIKVKKNDEVKAGDPIAAVGSRGPGGIHLHFEARPGEHLSASDDVRKTINPYEAAKEARKNIPEPSLTGMIAFTSDRDGNAEIYVMNADGSNQINITNNSAYDSVPCFSPDGTKIAFVSLRDGNAEIYIMNADGSNQTRLTNNPAWDSVPCFSPDGTKIAFESDRDGNYEIYIMNADGSNQTNITNNSAWDWVPCFSPDGTKIAFISARDGNYEIYIMNADGSNQTNITNNSAYDMDPCFSPDGTMIAFTSDRDGNSEIYIMNADGSNQTNITNNSAYDVSPSWGP